MTDPSTTHTGFVEALQVGKELPNSLGWKVAQNYINAIVSIIPIIGAFVPAVSLILTPDVIATLAGVVGSVNAYITTASTTKIGL
jgi:VIT1/CCC1 family predicted Fe2+/Mn2+ transporter